jgi:hypothetical protein
MISETIVFLASVILIRTLFYIFLFKKRYSYFYYIFAIYKFKNGNYLENTISDSLQVIIVALIWTSYDFLLGRI